METKTTMSIDDLKTAADFREFFAAIPDERWTTGGFVHGEQCCALGLLGARLDFDPPAEIRIREIFRLIDAIPTRVNDGREPRYKQATPKARILAALDDIAALKGGAK